MNKWVKRKWVRALRSGKYEQTQGTLNRLQSDTTRPVGFCCLGVLVEEMVPEFFQVDEYLKDRKSVDNDYGSIPDDLSILWDLTPDDKQRLINMNDAGRSFATIAAYIEREL